MGKITITLNKHMHPYVELFDRVYSEAKSGNPLFRTQAVIKDENTVEQITGPGFTLKRLTAPRRDSYIYSNGIDSFFVSRILNASAIVRIGDEEYKFENILTSPKALVFLKDISNTLNAILKPKSEEPKQK